MFLKAQTHSSAQGTIEYLVILAIIIVISLTIVSLSINSTTPAQNISGGISRLSTSTTPISIVDATIDPDGEVYLRLGNNVGESVTIKTITIEDETYSPDKLIFTNNKQGFLIPTNITCTEGTTKTIEVTIDYETLIPHKQKFPEKIIVNCETTTITDPTIEELPNFKFMIQTTTENQNFNFQIDGASEMQIKWGITDEWETLTNGDATRTKTYPTPGDYNIELKGTATRIAFGKSIPIQDICSGLNGTPGLLKDIFTPIGNSISGLTSANCMFGSVETETFTSTNFFDSASQTITDMKDMFLNSDFNQDISNWNTSNVTTMERMFFRAKNFNQSINNWNTSNLINMDTMFYRADTFNQPLNNWNTSKVTNMEDAFMLAIAFNQPLNNWNTSNVTTMESMFCCAESFNQPLNNWNTSNVTTMESMFYCAESFNQPLNNWNTSNVTTMESMFCCAESFNQPLNNWNTSNVTTMESMFYYAESFNQPLNNWNTNNVTNMWKMFYSAYQFNQPLNDWNVLNVTLMTNMFRFAESFNQNISGWNVDNVYDCGLFSQDPPLDDLNKPSFSQCNPN
jgi:surface protein